MRSAEKIATYKELRVYKNAMDAGMEIFRLSQTFPVEERYSLTDQIRRSSRSVCANLAEAWRKRRYSAHFVSKLSDAESEAEEVRVWLEFANRCGYLDAVTTLRLDDAYDKIVAQLVKMIDDPEHWIIKRND